MPTHDNVTSFGRKIQMQIEALEGQPYVKTGFPAQAGENPVTSFSDAHQDENGEKTNLTVGDIAVIHEFGSADGLIPMRSFLRSTFDARHAEWVQMTDRLRNLVFKGKMDVKKALGLMGLKMQAETKQTIKHFIPPALKPKTILRKTVQGKKGEIPLIDTGQMINSITFKVFDSKK